MSEPTTPDVEAILAERLGESPALGRVVDAIEPEAGWPQIVIALVGGVWDRRAPVPILLGGRVQVDVYHDSKAEAHDLARQAEYRLLTAAGAFDFGSVSGVESSLSLRWNPELESGRARYTFEVRVYARALAPSP